MADIFISYARRDRAPIESLARALEAAGYSVWWDHQIAGGAAFGAEIERQLNAARAVVVAWSIGGVQSEWVMDEAAAAKQAGKLIPIALDTTQPPLGFRQYHVIDFSDWSGASDAEAVLMLQRSIDRLAGGAPRPRRDEPGEVAPPAAGNAIAVLPLENLSGDPSQQFFVDGMHEALITDLSKVSAVKVISRTSTRRYAGAEKSLREIGAELGASKIIEGSVIRSGDEVRITVQLIDARSDTHLWAETFDRDITSVLRLQREVARAIVEEISVILTPSEKARLGSAPRVHPEAYEAYLKGMYHWYRLTPHDTQAALEYFDAALAIDSSYAPAHAGIGMTWAGIQQMGAAPTAVAGPKIRSAVQKALELDPDLAQAHFTLAAYYTWVAWDWARAEREFRRAIELNPSFPDAHAYYAHYLSIVGRYAEAEVEMTRAINLDPFNPLVRALYVACLFCWERYEEVLVEAKKVLDTAPDHWLAFQVMRHVSYNQDNHDQAIEATRSLYTTLGNGEVVSALDRGLDDGGHRRAYALAAEVLAEQAESRFVLPTQIASLFGMARDVESTVRWLERAFAIRDPDLPYLRCARRFSPEVMNDPRVQKIIDDLAYPEDGIWPASAQR
jgi:adenylate cyclase